MVLTLFQQYWEIPDGTECHRKTYATTGIGGAVGLITSAYSVALQPAGSFLAAAVGAIFGLATSVSTQVREKPDDPLNDFIGGCAGEGGGLSLGVRTHSYATGAAAALLKMGRLEGWKPFPEPKV
ncbi:NADH dehydrogenase [ubiquinone] 1 alpha subcomplex subunit 11-like [Sorex araneus]|uniref:NADH dehydrogenase [ubiquinone] 1 alpha subcomplex subunit 11-like n=1 Tax=Sorex araneus TaxID=42254 RepID=UPI002433792D|nr:NADH dehydrogenase [ubiquinone] 1 alpha subcomplex subunit 11-like [Sorex araneus]